MLFVALIEKIKKFRTLISYLRLFANFVSDLTSFQGEFHVAMMEQTLFHIEREARGERQADNAAHLSEINIKLTSCSERREMMRQSLRVTLESTIDSNRRVLEALAAKMAASS